ncbi:MFS transporter [Paenibacillus albiflavus]|uniref:MFS transporter n=1 Tax=Paenibacillus albiflavus TaxID=2545760 RepID=A0A4R4EN16_9BACL|nr:MFS transporter [Paenibacillus albiflavus]TCZ79891.1 MFS transporter [Paenibacillus albiflavus]
MNQTSNWLPFFKQSHPSIKLILLWNLLFCLGQGIYLALYNLYLNVITSDYDLGAIVTTTYVCYAIFSIVAGTMADRMGTKKTVLIGLIILVIGLLGSVVVHTTIALFVWSVFMGIGQAFTVVIFVPLLTEYSKSEQRTRLFSLAFGSGTFALFIGTASSGIISDQLKTHFTLLTEDSLRIALLLSILFIMLSCIPLWFVSGFKQTKAASEKRSIPKQSYGVITRFGIIKFVDGIAIGLVIPFMSLFLTNRYLLEPSMISSVLAAGTFGTMIMMFLNPRMTTKFGDLKSLVIYQAIGIPCLFILGIFTNLWFTAACFFLFRSMYYSMLPIQSKFMMDKVHIQIRGLTNSIGFMMSTISTGLASSLHMYLVVSLGDRYGYMLIFMLSAIAMSISIAYFYYTFKRKEVSSHRSDSLSSVRIKSSESRSL